MYKEEIGIRKKILSSNSNKIIIRIQIHSNSIRQLETHNQAIKINFEIQNIIKSLILIRWKRCWTQDRIR